MRKSTPKVSLLVLIVVEILFLDKEKDWNGKQENGILINPKPFASKKPHELLYLRSRIYKDDTSLKGDCIEHLEQMLT